MDTILTARSMSQTESEGSDTDILKYAFINVNEVPEFEETDSTIIHHPTARFLKANSKKISSFDFLGSPAKQRRLLSPEPEAPTIRAQLPLETKSLSPVRKISDSITIENESNNMQVILPNRLSKVSVDSTFESSEGCHKFAYGDFNANALECKSKEASLNGIKFIHVDSVIDKQHVISEKQFPSSKFYLNYVHWSHSIQSDLVQYITVNEKDMNQNRIEPEIKSVSFSGFSAQHRFSTLGTRPILKPVYRLHGFSEISERYSVVFLKESDYDSSMEVNLMEQEEMERNPPPEKRRKLNAPDEYEEEEEEEEIRQREEEVVEEEGLDEEERLEPLEAENKPTMNNNNNNEAYSADIENKFGIFKICNELTNRSEILSVSSNPTLSDYIYNPFGSNMGLTEDNSTQSSLHKPASLLKSSLGSERELLIEDQYCEILDETAFHKPLLHSTMMNMTNFDLGMFQPVYDDSTGNNAMSAPSGEIIYDNDSLNQPDPPPYRIFVQSSFSGSGSGTDYTYANIPYFNMYGMDASTDSESRIEDVTEEDDNYRESRKQIETLFPANDPILSRKESTSCVLVDGLLEYDEDADVIQDDFDVDVDQQEILMQPNPQLKYSTSFHSVLDARRHHISKANQLRQKRTKSDFYINQLRLSSSFDQLCRKRVEETAKNSDDNESFAEVDVCNLQDSIHNRDFNIDEDPVTSSKSLFASVKNSLVACYQRFLSRNRVNCKSNSSSLEPNAAKDREALESEKNEFQRSSRNLSNYSKANCFHAIQDNGEICITHIYENGESMSGSSLTQNLEKPEIYLERNSFQDSLMMEIPNSMSHHSKTKGYESKNSDCNAINTQENGNVEEKSSNALTLQSSELPEYIGELSSAVPQSEETIPLLSKSSNSSQKVLTAEAKKSSKESPTNKQGILKRFFGMFRTKIVGKSKQTSIINIGSSQITTTDDDRTYPHTGNENTRVEMNNNNATSVQSQLAPKSVKNDKTLPCLAHHTDSRELYRERRRKFFREQKEFRDESIMAYFTNIIGASQQNSLNPSKHVSVKTSPTTGLPTVASPELLIPAALPVLSLLNQSKSDEVLITARRAMSECLVPERKKRLGQSLILKLPPVVPLIAAAVAKVQQEASLNSSITGSSNVTDENPLEEICPPLEACIQSKDIDNSRNQQTVIAYPTKGILRQNNSKM